MANMNPNQEPEIEILSSQPETYDDAGNASTLPPEKPVSAEALEELEMWKKRHDEVKEQLVWMAADFDNYKKRALKEKDEFLKFSQAGVLKEMLVVVDNLERALAALPADDQDKGLLILKQGVEMTLKQFHSVLEKARGDQGKDGGREIRPQMSRSDVPGGNGQVSGRDGDGRTPKRVPPP